MTDTLEIAKKCGAYIGYDQPDRPSTSFWEEDLQAFREAIEAECEAERMKQPAFGYVTKYTKKFLSLDQVIDEQYSADTVDVVYAKPFPSTEQLQQQVKWLQETLYKVGDFCEKKSKASRNAFSNRINAEMELTMKLAAFDALATNIKKALANTQGEKK